MKKALLLATVSIALCTSGSYAFEQLAEAELTFQAIDLNTDGFISAEEAVSNETLMNQFSTLDTDKDGMLNETEFSFLAETAN
ncbi:MAG: EF-hand domain-containing protein [Reinekea sp.]|jgi:Ca2+-binding EF-hand superfamily protein